MHTFLADMTTYASKTIPITVFTGFLGAGKTTLLLSLLSRLEGTKVAVLKNEFGDVEVDSALIKQTVSPNNSSIAVQEMMNGCLCCVLVGQMKNALIEMRDKYQPDRILVETSGSAFPAPIAWQIRQLTEEGAGFELDAILTVVDCINFNGYEDTSYTAQLQAKYSDVIILNKYHLVSEQQLDRVIDRVNDLNTDTPKIYFHPERGADPALFMGLETQLFPLESMNEHSNRDKNHHQSEIDIIQISVLLSDPRLPCLIQKVLISFLSKLDKEDVFRVKGLLRCKPDKSTDVSQDNTCSLPNVVLGADSTLACSQHVPYLVNFAFGRGSFTLIPPDSIEPWKKYKVRLTVMGLNLKPYVKKFSEALQLSEEHCTFLPANRH